ncbi:hypothetical protein TREMEDRAFT_56799, partial [Tremella mesenterica DSM 1558]|uniref:uncharacterized protein n=1 Tax=Tremella mesenterica (strain ATCC 24925 / CBS 8224 / DSM 1558 / NBRC 9311 / NRRL Y-6157 / RJB 2259-6 / UBC 559-6) TaxID=578456 RepID=UPI0003F49E28
MTTFVPSPRRTRSQVASLKSANPSTTMNTITPTPTTSSSIPRLKSSASLRIPKPTPTASTTTSILPTEKITPSASINNGKLLRKSSVRSIRAAPRPVSSVGDVNPPSRLGRTMSRIRRDVDPSPQTITTSLKTSDRTPGFKEEKSINRD